MGVLKTRRVSEEKRSQEVRRRGHHLILQGLRCASLLCVWAAAAALLSPDTHTWWLSTFPLDLIHLQGHTTLSSLDSFPPFSQPPPPLRPLQPLALNTRAAVSLQNRFTECKASKNSGKWPWFIFLDKKRARNVKNKVIKRRNMTSDGLALFWKIFTFVQGYLWIGIKMKTTNVIIPKKDFAHSKVEKKPEWKWNRRNLFNSWPGFFVHLHLLSRYLFFSYFSKQTAPYESWNHETHETSNALYIALGRFSLAQHSIPFKIMA